MPAPPTHRPGVAALVDDGLPSSGDRSAPLCAIATRAADDELVVGWCDHILDRMGAGVSDIVSRSDCERLVRAFYGRALDDPVIGWIFVDVAQLDLEAHVPRITSFWETILLGARSYSGGAFGPHAALHARIGLRAGHFERWLWLWRTTVDDLFAGERAELAKSHAARVAQAFHARLQTMPVQRPGVAASVTITQHGPTRLAVVKAPDDTT